MAGAFDAGAFDSVAFDTGAVADVSGGVFPRRRIQTIDSEEELIILLAEYEYMM